MNGQKPVTSPAEIALYAGIDSWFKDNWKVLLLGAVAGAVALHYVYKLRPIKQLISGSVPTRKKKK